MDRTVTRGLATREFDDVKHAGIDEKSFRKGHDYVSVMTDIDQSSVIDVAEGGDETAAPTVLAQVSPTEFP